MKFITSVCCLLSLVCLISCSPKNTEPQPLSPQQKVKAWLTSGEWKLQSVSVDGVDQTAEYSGFKIRFTQSTYTTINGKAVWQQNGTWKFDVDEKTIKRNDGLVIQIAVDSSSLTMTFDWASGTLGSGKTESTAGRHIFTMVH